MHADTLLILQMSLLLLTIGAVGGFLSGLLGVGGGILFVPALFFCLSHMGLGDGHAMQVAVGSSLAVILVTGSTAAYAHWRRGSVDLERIRIWAVPMVVGVGAGSFFAGIVHGNVLKGVFATLTALIALYMIFARDAKSPSECPIFPNKYQKMVCAFIGFVSSMIGVGGAIMTVPFMNYLGMPMQRSAGTGSALGILIALPGTAAYVIMGLFHMEELPPFSLGYVNFLAVAMMIPASIFTAPWGVQAAHSLPRSMLRRVFAVVMIIVTIRMFMTL